MCNKKSNILGCDAFILLKFTSVSEELFSFLLGIKNSEVAGFSEASGVTPHWKKAHLEKHILKIVAIFIWKYHIPP